MVSNVVEKSGHFVSGEDVEDERESLLVDKDGDAAVPIGLIGARRHLAVR
jgi:hypothetical protein